MTLNNCRIDKIDKILINCILANFHQRYISRILFLNKEYYLRESIEDSIYYDMINLKLASRYYKKIKYKTEFCFICNSVSENIIRKQKNDIIICSMFQKIETLSAYISEYALIRGENLNIISNRLMSLKCISLNNIYISSECIEFLSNIKLLKSLSLSIYTIDENLNEKAFEPILNKIESINLISSKDDLILEPQLSNVRKKFKLICMHRYSFQNLIKIINQNKIMMLKLPAYEYISHGYAYIKTLESLKLFTIRTLNIENYLFFKEIIQQSPCLNTLDIVIDMVEDLIFDVYSSINKLQILQIRVGHRGKNFVKTLTNIGKNCKLLKIMDIHLNTESNDNIFSQLIGSCKYLRKFVILSNKNFGYEFLKKFTRNKPYLKDLNLYNTCILSSVQILDILKNNKNLTCLSCKISDLERDETLNIYCQEHNISLR